MKTLHRLMYENLTPEEYKEFCKCKLSPDELREDYSDERVRDALLFCMCWDHQPQEHDYWETVYCRLRELNK